LVRDPDSTLRSACLSKTSFSSSAMVRTSFASPFWSFSPSPDRSRRSRAWEGSRMGEDCTAARHLIGVGRAPARPRSLFPGFDTGSHGSLIP